MHQLVPGFILRHYGEGQTAGQFTAVGMFVDTSGFSTMTDVLMEHGQHGAEVLAGVMHDVFEPTIQRVAEQGGLITSIEGDAFTALFPLDAGDAAAVAWGALTAACQIQRLFAGRPTYKTVYGEFRITVKVGLALGEAAWGVISSADGRRAVSFFQGSAIDEAAASEHYAAPGQVILDGGINGLLEGRADVEALEGYYRLAQAGCSDEEGRPIAPPEFDLELARRFFPAELFTYDNAGEFRQVTYLFIGLPTVRSEAQLRIFMQTAFELQDTYGGILELYFGDKGAHMQMMWGAPVAYENDIERALNFILELQRQTAIPLSAGVTHRVAFAGLVGSELAAAFACYGRGPNLAARFMTGAARGEIWVDETIARRMEQRFVLEYGGEKRLKGFAQPQAYYLLLDRKEEVEVFYTGALAGREEELSALEEFFHPLFDRDPTFAGVMVIYGEPGMGKSRLAHEFLERLGANAPRPFQVFLAQADEILRLPLNLFRYWLRRYFQVTEAQGEMRNKHAFNHKLNELLASLEDGRLAEELDRTRSFLGALVDLHWFDSLYEQLDAKDRYENTFLGLAALLQAESLRQPVIFFIEDAHRLDEESRLFAIRLLKLFSGQASYRIAMLVTARLEGAGLAVSEYPHRILNLDRLSRAGLAGLAGGHLGGPVSENLVNLLEERSDGNPFFAEQMLRYLEESKLLAQQPGGWSAVAGSATSLPADVSALLIARLDRLPREVKEVVQMAAVLGREFEVAVLSRMLRGDAHLPERINSAEQAAVWTAINEQRYIFRHVLMRDAAYEMQLLSRRQVLHALALKALEKIHAGALDTHYPELAYHAEQAGIPARALHYYRLAGDKLREQYQNMLAVDYYTRALRLCGENHVEMSCELLLARQEIYNLTGKETERQQDLAELTRLAASLDDPSWAIQVLLAQTSYALITGSYAEAVELAQQAIGQAESAGDPSQAVKAYQYASSALLRQHRLEPAAAMAWQGWELAHRIDDQKEECRAQNGLGLIAAEQGLLEEARDHYLRALEIAQALGELRDQSQTLNNLGNVFGAQGRYAEAQQAYEQSLALTRRVGDRGGETINLINLGWILGNLGDFSRAREYAAESVRIGREVGDPYSESYGLINLSAYCGALGEHVLAEITAGQALEITRRAGIPSAEAWALTYRGHSRLALGRPEEAARDYQAALEIRRELNQPVLATEPGAGLARIALAAGDLDRAREILEPVLVEVEQGTLERTDEPLRVYLTCYLALRQMGDPRAGSILATAHSLLMARAGSIPDEAARRLFLEIPHHREIVDFFTPSLQKDHPG